jgi:serine/threonine protein kinase
MKMVTNLLLTCSFLFSRGEIDQEAGLLEWHKRHAIALGIAKGLRFLHEECRAGPIIHRDLRPSNVLLTHDFVPMVSWMALTSFLTVASENANDLCALFQFSCPIFDSLGTLVLQNGRLSILLSTRGFWGNQGQEKL